MFSDEALDLVLAYPKLSERLASRPEDLVKVKKIFKEIHGEFSPTVVNSAVKVIWERCAVGLATARILKLGEW